MHILREWTRKVNAPMREYVDCLRRISWGVKGVISAELLTGLAGPDIRLDEFGGRGSPKSCGEISDQHP